MNGVRLTLLMLLALFFLLLPISRRMAMRYARFALLAVVGTVIMLPFVWLVCAAFKDPDVLNEYTFLPPPQKISNETINLDNFRTLFEPTQTVQGPVIMTARVNALSGLGQVVTGGAVLILVSWWYGHFRRRRRQRRAMLGEVDNPPSLPAAALSPDAAEAVAANGDGAAAPAVPTVAEPAVSTTAPPAIERVADP